MKIEERDGEQLVIFEEGVDDALRDEFYKGHAALTEKKQYVKGLLKQYEELGQKLEIECSKLKIFELEHHDEIWDPINEAVKTILGVEQAPGMIFEAPTQKLTIASEERKQDMDEARLGFSMLRRLLRL